jgi:MerR family transcriptional regulator, light-induced transcriptional regulator
MYRINVAARSAGVSPQLLRAWERRYGLAPSARSPAGYRLYTDDDVAVLRGAKALVEQGQTISEVARLPREALRLASSRAPAAAVTLPPGANDSFLAVALAAIVAFDGVRVETLILHATSMGALPPIETCDRVLMPLLVEIGARWEKGELDVAAEHFGSAIVRRHLHTLVESESRRNAGAPAVVCACAEGDLHEGGLLGFALHVAACGWGVVYLGANVPLGDLLAAAGHRRAAAIALSSSRPSSRDVRRATIDSISRWQRQSPGRRVWVGGRGAVTHAKEYRAAGLEVIERAESFAVSPGGA